jgi:VanZ family protein
MKYNKIAFWIVLIISFVLFFAPLPVGNTRTGFDKVVHAFVFEALVFLSFAAFPRKKFLMLLVFVAYAVGSEFIQGRFLPLRHFDWYDVTADLIGVATGLAIYFWNFYFSLKADN